MGRRRVGFNQKSRKTGVDALISATGDDVDNEEIEDDLEAMLDDEIDKYNADKDETLKGQSKASTSSSKAKKSSRPGGLYSDDEEEEVYPLDLEETDEEDDIHDKRIALSGSELEDDDEGDVNDDEDDLDSTEDDDDEDDEDILGSKDIESELPDSRAWGRRAKLYHNTDYVDQDFGGFQGNDEEQAQLEELEAKEIQQRLTAELDEDAFLDFLPPQQEGKGGDKQGDKGREILKVDFDSMSDADKKKFIQRECPELLHLLEEYKDKLKEAHELEELMNKDSDVPVIKEFYVTKYHTILNYCINISFFLNLRATSPSMCKGHPVIKRILQFRRLLEELQEFNVKAVKLDASTSNAEGKDPKPKSSKSKKVRTENINPFPQLKKKVQPQPIPKSFEDMSKVDEENLEDNESEKEDELEKRGITYEMAKNKGLTPARSKLQRNPRVKHRVKFRKATIRRKGQVRTARHEIKKYDGESFGIKAHLTKSIKLK